MILIRDTNEYMIKLDTEVKIYRDGYAILQGEFPKSEIKNIAIYIPNNISRYINRLCVSGNAFHQLTGKSRYVYYKKEILISFYNSYSTNTPVRFYSTSKSTLSKLKLMT